MRRVGQARMRDANEPQIVNALRDIGVLVQPLNVKDFADLLCFSRSDGFRLIQVKNPDGFNRLSEGELDTYQLWPTSIIRSVAEALALYGVTK